MADPRFCPRCGTANPPDAASCSVCGWAPPPAQAPEGPTPSPRRPLESPTASGPLICPRCGAANPPDASSCAACGWQPAATAPVAAAAPPDESGERTAHRRKPILLGSVLGGVVVLGVGIALLLHLGVFGHRGAAPAAVESPSRQQPSDKPASGSAPSTGSSSQPTATPSKSPDFTTIYKHTKSGVFKVVATGCGDDGTKIGTATLIDKDRAVAAYSSLAHANVVALSRDGTTVPATVDGVDTDAGVVVLKLDHPVKGHHFTVADDDLTADDPAAVAAVPATKNTPTLKTAEISDTKSSTRVGDTKITDLTQVKVTDDPGMSGAPILNGDGKVSGIVAASGSSQQTAAVPGSAINDAPASEPMPGTDCGDPLGPDLTEITGKGPADIKQTLQDYFDGINTGHYRRAYNQLAQSKKVGFSQKQANGWRTTYDFNIRMHNASGQHAYVSFNSISSKAKSPDGHRTCARWDLDYQFTDSGGGLLIEKTTKHGSRSTFWSKC